MDSIVLVIPHENISPKKITPFWDKIHDKTIRKTKRKTPKIMIPTQMENY